MGGNERLAQLPLPLRLADDATFANFMPVGSVAGPFQALGETGAEPLQFLHGRAASGKSHLLQAACHSAPGALYLPLAELKPLDAASLLAELEGAPRIAIDDVHCIAGSAAWQEALFHLINRCRDSGCELLFAARRPPAELGIELADLRSRLAGGLTWALPGYSDEELREILAFRAHRRGLELPPAVLDYLGRRARRSLADLLSLLERLDEASLQAQRPLTVPLVREVMAEDEPL